MPIVSPKVPLQLWFWPDGWRLVRPMDVPTLRDMAARLRGEGRFRGDAEQVGNWEELSKEGRFGIAFFLRPIAAPPGRPELSPSEVVAGALWFEHMPDGLVSICMLPGLYRPLVAELLRHVYDVALRLEPATSTGPPSPHLGRDPNDVATYFHDPKWAVENILQPQLLDPRTDHREWFVKAVARSVQGRMVGSLAGQAGSGFEVLWTPSPAPAPVLGSGPEVSTVWFVQKGGGSISVDFRTVQHHMAYRFVVTVGAPEGDWTPLPDGRALDLRNLVPARVHDRRDRYPGTTTVTLGDEPYFKALSERPDARFLPWTVTVKAWEDSATADRLEDALVKVGIVGRDVDDVKQAFRRRRIYGTPHSSFRVPLALGIVPELLVASFSELPDLMEAYGTV